MDETKENTSILKLENITYRISESRMGYRIESNSDNMGWSGININRRSMNDTDRDSFTIFSTLAQAENTLFRINNKNIEWTPVNAKTPAL